MNGLGVAIERADRRLPLIQCQALTSLGVISLPTEGIAGCTTARQQRFTHREPTFRHQKMDRFWLGFMKGATLYRDSFDTFQSQEQGWLGYVMYQKCRKVWIDPHSASGVNVSIIVPDNMSTSMA